MAKKVVIVGAGYAGIAAALHLNRKGKRDGVEVTIIDRNPYHTLLTELHEVAGNRQDEDSVRIPLKEIFRDTRVNIVTDNINKFDFDAKVFTGDRGSYTYDYAILALGSSPAFYGIPGMKENAFTLWSFDDAVKIREHIKDCFARAGKTQDPAERKRLLTFAVGGAGFTGVEMIGELAHWVKPLCRAHGIDRKEVRLVLLDMLKRVLPNLDEVNSAKSHRYMEKKLGIEILLETAITEMKTDRAVIKRGDVITELPTATMIWCAGVAASESLREAALETVGGAKRVQVDDFCFVGRDDVYAVGDSGGLCGENRRPYAAMVENALQTAEGAAANILRHIRGQKPEKVTVKFHGTMVCIGNYFAVSEIMGKRLPSWLSMVMKFLVNVHYLFEIMGFRGPARYLKDELVHRRQDMTLVEQHYTRKMQAWWTVPLRMFLGGYWLYEGIQKITEGWLGSPRLAEFMGMARGYELTDVATSATAGGTALRMDTLVDVNLKVVQFILGKASTLVEGNAISEAIFGKINVLHFDSFNFVPWLIQGWALSSHTWEMLFQIVITLAEVVIGLMLLGGFFTFAAAAGSGILLAMFVTSTGLYLDSWWMAFASIVCLGGAGRAFGLDYYAIPWFTRAWEYYWKNRRIKVFFPLKRGREWPEQDT